MSTVELRLVVLRCADLERSRSFYAALGLALRTEQHGAGPPHYSCTLGDTVLELYPKLTYPATTGVRLGFRLTDVRTAVEAVRSADVGEVLRMTDAPPVDALLRDPDGNTVHLERAPG